MPSPFCEILDKIAVGIGANDWISRIAVDGVDGVGKSTFADRLAARIERDGHPVIRSSIDGFHNPRALRYQRGRSSPEGFYLDSYDYRAFHADLLEPLGPDGSGRYRSAVFDHASDALLPDNSCQALPGSLLVVDGIFLQRAELRGAWDLSIFLDAPFAVTIPRGAARGPGWGSPDPTAPSNHRYVEGHQIYQRENQPQSRANIVIDGADLALPSIRQWRWPQPDARCRP